MEGHTTAEVYTHTNKLLGEHNGLIPDSKGQAATATKLEELTREVRAHNNFAQRVPVLEEKCKAADHRIQDLEQTTERLRTQLEEKHRR